MYFAMKLARFCDGSIEYFMSRPVTEIGNWMKVAGTINRDEREAAEKKSR